LKITRPVLPTASDNADAPSTDQTVEVVVDDGVGETRDQVGLAGAALQVRVDVALHEDGAALPQADRLVRREGQLGELVDDLDTELLGLLLEDRARAGGAGLKTEWVRRLPGPLHSKAG
jgi:hypothetical protein